MQVLAAIFRDQSGRAEIEPVELADPRDDEIVVRMVATGICHTDIMVSHRTAPTPYRPIVLGHEGAGVVEWVGDRVTKVTAGDHVVLTYDSCGRCSCCLSGLQCYCDQFGPRNFSGFRPDGSTPMTQGVDKVAARFFGQSSFAEKVIGTERNVIKIRKDVPLKLLAPLGCGIQTGAGSVLNVLKPRADQSIAIFGCGAVGLSAVMAARIAGAGAIIAVDLHPHRIALAMELGATHGINSKSQNVEDEIRAVVARGIDLGLDSTGAGSAIEQLVGSMAPAATAAFVASPQQPISVTVRHLLAGRKLIGVTEGESVPELLIPLLVDLFDKGQLPVDKFAKFYRFDQINEAIRDSESGTTVKPILEFPS